MIVEVYKDAKNAGELIPTIKGQKFIDTTKEGGATLSCGSVQAVINYLRKEKIEMSDGQIDENAERVGEFLI